MQTKKDSVLGVPGQKVYLGSRSPRRKQLLEQLGFELEPVLPDFAEVALEGESARDYVLRNSQGKAESLYALMKDHAASGFLIAADTVVSVGGTILEKPADRDQAQEMLSQLSGNSHSVLSGVFIEYWRCGKSLRKIRFCCESSVQFKVLTQSELDFYLNTREWEDKAGSYGIQGIGGFMVEKLAGSWSNVVGLPLAECVEAMGSCMTERDK